MLINHTQLIWRSAVAVLLLGGFVWIRHTPEVAQGPLRDYADMRYLLMICHCFWLSHMTYASKRKTRPLLILHYLLMLLLMFVSLFYLPWEIFSLWSINVALFAVGFWTLDRVMRKLLNML